MTHKKRQILPAYSRTGKCLCTETYGRKNEFIKKLVELMMNHGIKKEDILAIFQKEAKDIRVGDMHNGEFDFWVRFRKKMRTNTITVLRTKGVI